MRPNIAEEHSRVFNYSKGKSRTAGKGKAPLKKVPSCSIKFCCLGFVDSNKLPTTIASKTALAIAGLGPATISFDMNGSPVHSRLIKRYPKLQNEGGYELLLYQRGGEQQGFHILPTPQTPSRIKEIANAAVVYIRPLQQDILDMEEHTEENTETFAQEVRVHVSNNILANSVIQFLGSEKYTQEISSFDLVFF